MGEQTARRACAVVGCTNVAFWRQQCERHARRMLTFQPLHGTEAPRQEQPTLVCRGCGKGWERPAGGRARYCSPECRMRASRTATRPRRSSNADRDASIRQAVVAGERTVAELALAHELTYARVWQIVHGWRRATPVADNEPAQLVCAGCGDPWQRPPGSRAQFCSRTCRSEHLGRVARGASRRARGRIGVTDRYVGGDLQEVTPTSGP